MALMRILAGLMLAGMLQLVACRGSISRGQVEEAVETQTPEAVTTATPTATRAGTATPTATSRVLPTPTPFAVAPSQTEEPSALEPSGGQPTGPAEDQVAAEDPGGVAPPEDGAPAAEVVQEPEAPIDPGGGCDPAYPDGCIPVAPPDLDCADVPFRRFTVFPPDPHGFDGDFDGVGCER
jgi:hypothetical protein